MAPDLAQLTHGTATYFRQIAWMQWNVANPNEDGACDAFAAKWLKCRKLGSYFFTDVYTEASRVEISEYTRRQQAYGDDHLNLIDDYLLAEAGLRKWGTFTSWDSRLWAQEVVETMIALPGLYNLYVRGDPLDGLGVIAHAMSIDTRLPTGCAFFDSNCGQLAFRSRSDLRTAFTLFTSRVYRLKVGLRTILRRYA